VLTDSRNVKVLPTLQLPSQPSIFAMGDIIDWKEQKQAFKSYSHGSIIASNILSLLNGPETLKKYKTGPEMMIVTNGKVSFD
jgi:NADH dehydrogenase FAD-containing subunit